MSGAVVGGFHRCGNERRARGANQEEKFEKDRTMTEPKVITIQGMKKYFGP
jgi:hypothetical protein